MTVSLKAVGVRVVFLVSDKGRIVHQAYYAT
jgi:hypothetical protein